MKRLWVCVGIMWMCVVCAESAQEHDFKQSMPYGKKLRRVREGYGRLSGEKGLRFSPFSSSSDQKSCAEKSAEPSLVAVSPKSSIEREKVWRACLDVLSFMPLASSDAVGGVVLTDWYTEANHPHQRVKVMVRLGQAQSKEKSDLHVQVYRQTQTQGTWVAEKDDSARAQKLKHLIIEKAQSTAS